VVRKRRPGNGDGQPLGLATPRPNDHAPNRRPAQRQHFLPKPSRWIADLLKLAGSARRMPTTSSEQASAKIIKLVHAALLAPTNVSRPESDHAAASQAILPPQSPCHTCTTPAMKTIYAAHQAPACAEDGSARAVPSPCPAPVAPAAQDHKKNLRDATPAMAPSPSPSDARCPEAVRLLQPT